jgi:hypothetical protein
MKYTSEQFINSTFKNEYNTSTDDNVIHFVNNYIIKHITFDMFNTNIIKLLGLQIKDIKEFKEYAQVFGEECNDDSLQSAPWGTINEVYDKCKNTIGIDDIAANKQDCVNLIVSTIQDVLEKYPNSIKKINHSDYFIDRLDTSFYSILFNMNDCLYYFQLVLEPKVTV